MSGYEMAKGAVRASPHTEDVRLYAVDLQPDCDGEEFYPLGEGLSFEDDRGRQVYRDSIWTDPDLAEARVRFIKASGGVGGYGLLDYYEPHIVEIKATTRDCYILWEDK